MPLKRRIVLAAVLATIFASSVPANADDYNIEKVAQLFDAAMERKDYSAALQLIRPLVERGDPSAQNWLAKMYLRGDGVPQNPREGVRLLRLSAGAGNKWSQYYLGHMLLDGIVVEQDDVEAYTYLEMSSRQGVGEAQLVLGKLLSPGQVEGDAGLPSVLVDASAPTPRKEPGQRLPKDAALSAYWLKKATEQDLPDAQFSLGLAYEHGVGVPLNPIEAVRLYRLAAKQGHSSAQNNLGVKYSAGQGIGENHIKAYMWFVIAASSGNSNSTDNRDIERTRVTPRQRAQAEQMAAQCIATQFNGCD